MNESLYEWTSNMTAVIEVRSASFRLVLHVQHIFVQILLIFWSPGGYRLQFSISRPYFVYTARHCTGQHCSSIYMRVRIVCLPVRGAPVEWYYNTLLCCEDYFSSSSVVSRAFSALCVNSKFGHHPHPLGYLCAKFCFFRDLHCWASPWRKIAYSINHQITHPAYNWYPGNRNVRFGIMFQLHNLQRGLKLSTTIHNSIFLTLGYHFAPGGL